MTKIRWGAATLALVAGLCIAPTTAEATPGRHTYTGTIDGAEYKVETPHQWNGTLVLYSHPYYTPEVPPGIGHANRPETETWLLEHGYALAASDFKGRNGYTVKDALTDQIALLDWFEDNIGTPRHTVATGSSGGAVISLLLGERNPRRIDGVAAMCGPLDLPGTWNVALDINFALRELLAPNAGIELVKAANPAGSVRALAAAVAAAAATPHGRAKIALASSFGNLDGWNSAHAPRPAGLEAQIRDQVALNQLFFVGAFGAVGREDLERRAGGNPSWNTGVDYRRQLAQSNQLDLVRAAYREAGLDLDADLDALAAAPRIAADPKAAAWMHRYGAPRGTTPAPVLTLHNVADAADPAHERWYAGQVRKHGDPSRLRQLYAGRATHCAFSAAEEIAMMRALFERIDTGRWPTTSPARLNTAAGSLGEAYQKVFDFGTGQDLPQPPAFTRFSPPIPQRPSR